MTPDRPLFTGSAEERALLAFYDAVPAAELLDLATGFAGVSAEDAADPEVTPAQAVALVMDRLRATLVED